MGDYTWYRKGLSFECRQCGNCCSGEPGYVWVTAAERRQIAKALGVESEALAPKYIRRVGFRYSLTERSNGDCIFLGRNGERAGCEIYQVRPLQCRTWPFWNDVLQTGDIWDTTARKCPGMNHGRRYSYSEIEVIRAGRK